MVGIREVMDQGLAVTRHKSQQGYHSMRHALGEVVDQSKDLVQRTRRHPMKTMRHVAENRTFRYTALGLAGLTAALLAVAAFRSRKAGSM